MNTKQALTLDPFPILNFKEASKKLMGIKIMQICEEKKKTLSSWMVGRRGRGPRQKPKAWGGRERWWLVGVAEVADLSSWCGVSSVQRVVVSNLLQCVGVAADDWVRLLISSWCRGWPSPVRSVVEWLRWRRQRMLALLGEGEV
jgi:hypothetical protein